VSVKFAGTLVVTTLVAISATGVAADRDVRLIDAAKRQDEKAARELLKQKVDINARYGDGASALHWAAYRDDLAMADLLVRAGADVNAANDLGATPLSLACANANGAMVKRLLDAGANPNTLVTPIGETPLMTAARSGGVDAVKALLARGANVNAAETAHGQTALMWAAANGHPGVVEALIDARAEVNARSRLDRMVVSLLGQGEEPSGVEIDGGGLTPLFFAARRGDLASAKLLIAAGADVNVATPTKTSVLVFAAHSGHGQVAAYLLEKGADPNADGSGYTALHAAVLRGDLALVKALLVRGADPNARLKQGTPTRRASQDYNLSVQWIGASPFWLAAKFAETDIMRALAAGGSDSRITLPDGTTPLMAAANNSEYGRPQNDRRGRLRPLDEYLTSVRSGQDEREALAAVKAVTDAGAEVNAVNALGDTALHIAVGYKQTSVVEWLVDHGANVNVKNKRGQTPLSIANRVTRLTDDEGSIDTKMVELLHRFGAVE
jgi:uncharacterized protein